MMHLESEGRKKLMHLHSIQQQHLSRILFTYTTNCCLGRFEFIKPISFYYLNQRQTNNPRGGVRLVHCEKNLTTIQHIVHWEKHLEVGLVLRHLDIYLSVPP